MRRKKVQQKGSEGGGKAGGDKKKKEPSNLTREKEKEKKGCSGTVSGDAIAGKLTGGKGVSRRDIDMQQSLGTERSRKKRSCLRKTWVRGGGEKTTLNKRTRRVGSRRGWKEKVSPPFIEHKNQKKETHHPKRETQPRGGEKGPFGP